MIAASDVSTQSGLALVLAFASTVLINVAYLRQHDAAAALPALSLRRPLHSAHVLLTDRSWLRASHLKVQASPSTSRRLRSRHSPSFRASRRAESGFSLSPPRE